MSKIKKAKYTPEKENLKLQLVRSEQEIRELRLQLAQMHEHQAQFQKVRNMASILSWEANILTGKLTISKEATDLFPGGLFNSISFDDLVDRIHPDDRLDFQTAYERSLKDGGSFELTHRLVFPTGKIWTVTHHFITFLATNGMPLRSTGLIQNITLQKQSQDELETKVKERTRELKKAKIVAENASRAKSEFLARMSHELRTPLNAIIGFSQVLIRSKKEQLNPDQKEDIGRIQDAGKHLLQLINKVLDLSAIESGKINIGREPVNIASVMEEVLNLTLIWANKKNLKIINKITRNDIFALADWVGLKQVLLNLVSNAIKFNKPGGSITLSCEETPNIRICIADTGLGIRLNRQDSIFEPFSRLHPEETNIEGTGIGLSISKRLIEHMHGKISFSSVPDQGTSFFIDLPGCDPPPLLKEKNNISAGLSRVEENTSGSLSTILYIEDNFMNLSVMEKIFRDRDDIHFLSAPQAKLGLELARAHVPDLILMDINLPGMNGIEALKYLQNYKETKKIPVVAVSADAMETDIVKARKAGFKEYVTKPIDVDLFLEIVDSLLNKNGN